MAQTLDPSQAGANPPDDDGAGDHSAGGSGEGYERKLNSRTIQMIALGGAIGTGLFYGSGDAISRAGPSLILVYLVAGLAIFAVMRALGELLIYRPVAGSLAEYSEEFIGPQMGFTVGWTYWLVWITTCMAEITVAGRYVEYWWPQVPGWVTSSVVLGVLFVANIVSVKLFGRAEFWFSMIKVATIIGLIVIGILVLLPVGIGPSSGPSLSNLWDQGGVFPNGFVTALLSLQIVMFAYVGVELVGVTAGEAEDPENTLRKAVNTLPFRIGLFYIGSLTILMSVQSWRAYSADESPFVSVFEYIGIPGAASIVNLVLFTAALSSCNSGLYATGRMLRQLSTQGAAPSRFERLSNRALPANALVASAIAISAGIVVNIASPKRAFLYIASVAAIGIVFVWASILFSHLRYRRQVSRGEVRSVSYRLPGAPWTNYAALGLLGLVIVLMFFDTDGRIALVAGALWLTGVTVAWHAIQRRTPTATAPTT